MTRIGISIPRTELGVIVLSVVQKVGCDRATMTRRQCKRLCLERMYLYKQRVAVKILSVLQRKVFTN